MRSLGIPLTLLLIVVMAACGGGGLTATPTPDPGEFPGVVPTVPGIVPETPAGPFSPGDTTEVQPSSTLFPDAPPLPTPPAVTGAATGGILPVATPVPPATLPATAFPALTPTPRVTAEATRRASPAPVTTPFVTGTVAPTEAPTALPGTPTAVPTPATDTPGPTPLTPVATPLPTETPILPGGGQPVGTPTPPPSPTPIPPTITPRPPEPGEWSIELEVIPVDSDVIRPFNLLLGVDKRCPDAIGCTAPAGLLFAPGLLLRAYMCHSGGSDCNGFSGSELLSKSIQAPGKAQTWVVEVEFPGDLDLVFTWDPPRSNDDFVLSLSDGDTQTDMRTERRNFIARHDVSIRRDDGTKAFTIVYRPG